MSSLSDVNQYQNITMRVSSVAVYGTRTHGVMGSNPGEIKTFFFHAAAMLLFYRTQIITTPKCCIFRKNL
jgi:hypothetical protein